VPGAVPRPRHRRDDHPVHAAGHPWRVGLQHRPDRAQVQRPPPSPTLAAVVARRPALTQPTPALRAAHRTHPGHEQLRVLVELDPLNNGLLHTQKGTP